MTETKKNKVKQWIPIALLESANQDNWLQSLAYFIMLKSKYQNQTIYNFKPKKIADLLDISYNTAQHHLSILEEKGLIKRHNGNLTFLGVEKQKALVRNKRGAISKLLTGIFIAEGKKEQIENIRAAIIRLNIRRQIYVIKKKSETLSYSSCNKKWLTKSEYDMVRYCIKKVNKEGGRKKFEKTINSNVTLSNEKFGEVFGLSKHTGKRIQKMMRKRKFIVSRANFKKYAPCTDKFMFRKSFLPSKYYFNSRFKCIYYQTANVIELVNVAKEKNTHRVSMCSKN